MILKAQTIYEQNDFILDLCALVGARVLFNIWIHAVTLECNAVDRFMKFIFLDKLFLDRLELGTELCSAYEYGT